MKKAKKYFINLIFMFFILIIIFNVSNEKEENTQIKSYDFLSAENNIVKINEEIIETVEYEKEDIVDNYNGYKVCAKLVIPAISLETNVLENYSLQALNVSVVKFWGVEPNKIGNFCIAGHNFKNKNMFSNLKKLKLGDTLFVTDREIGKVEYEIFKIDTVLPTEVDCLKSVTENEREVTLITCTTNSKKRIIIKAKEI
jgi:LPXTG-site transpeptidase (sortase) family protein